MRGEYQNRKVWARGKEVFIGVDVHKESWHVTVRTEEEQNPRPLYHSFGNNPH